MKDNSLLVAAAVAVVAIVGLILFAQGGTTGEVIIINPENPAYRGSAPVAGPEDYQAGEALGEQLALECAKEVYSQQQCCSRGCSDVDSKDAHRGCSYTCQLRVAQGASDHIDLV